MLEVKTDALEASFEALEREDEDVAALRGEVAALKAEARSVAAQLGTGSSVAYAASKAALNAMTYSMARSLGPEVRVNAVAPTYIATPLNAFADKDSEMYRRWIDANMPDAEKRRHLAVLFAGALRTA